MAIKKKANKVKCRICGKVIHRGGLHRNGRHYHKACFNKLSRSTGRIKWD